jgi:hypothetical protein
MDNSSSYTLHKTSTTEQNNFRQAVKDFQPDFSYHPQNSLPLKPILRKTSLAHAISNDRAKFIFYIALP